MTETKPSPTYRQRFNGLGGMGVCLTVFAPVAYAVIGSFQQNADAWNRPGDLWYLLATIPAVLGPILMLVGREYYDATAEIAAAKNAAPPAPDRDAPLNTIKVRRY